MQSKKSKIIAIVSAICAVGALSGVGYAAWVITAGATQTLNGSITVDTVSDKRIGLTAATTSVITYGHPVSDPSTTYSWLKYDGDVTEQLTLSVDVTVTNVSSLSKVTFALTADGGTNTTGYASAVTSTYVGALPTIADIADADLTENTKKTVTATFTWGKAFDSKNPYKYYNDQAYTTTLGDGANTALSGLATDLADVKYKLVVTAVAA